MSQWIGQKTPPFKLLWMTECFPKALLHPVGPDGSLDETTRTEPIAADFRLQPHGRQGWTNPTAYREALVAQRTHRTKAIPGMVNEYDKKLQLGINKVLVGALGVPLGTLTQREKAFQPEKARHRVGLGVLQNKSIAGYRSKP